MPDPDQPQLTPAEQAARDDFQNRKETARKVLQFAKPFSWAKVLDQLAKFENVAEKGVKSDVRKDREWAEQFINVNVRGPGLETTDFNALIETMQVRPVPSDGRGGGQGGSTPGPTPQTPTPYPPEHQRYPENIVYQHTDGKMYVKKAGAVFTVTPDGVIRNQKGWPVGTYNFATREISWQESPPGYPPGDITYARKLINECTEAVAKIKRITDRQNEQLLEIKGVEDILIRREGDILSMVDEMQRLYTKHRLDAKKAAAKKESHKGLHDGLLRRVAELRSIGQMMKDASQPLIKFHNLLAVSRIDAEFIHKLTERVKVIDTLITDYPVMRKSAFGELDKEALTALQMLGVSDVNGLLVHLEESVTRKQRYAAELAAAKLGDLRDHISLYEGVTSALSSIIRKNITMFNYDEEGIAKAIPTTYGGKPILVVIVDTAQEALAILVNIEKIEGKIGMEIDVDRDAIKVIERSLVQLEEALARSRQVRRAA